jgi:predicted metal-dependent enzyme (double-stranded beta helix superfamily)
VPFPAAHPLLPRARGRDLDAGELRAVVDALAARPEAWAGLVRHDPEQRLYEELLRDEHLAVWLICWMDDHDTGFHDHDDSSGAVAVVRGELREERLAVAGPPAARRFSAGASFSFAAYDIHRVWHAGGEPSVSLHAYSPPLRRMGSYVVETTGALRRHSVSYADELRPLGAATP